MRLLADECIARPLVEKLRHDGHDVAWIMDDSASAPDEEVLDRAFNEGRILLTEDKDFGELTIRFDLPTHGLIIISLGQYQTSFLVARVAQAINDLGNQVENALIVIEHQRIRRRNLSSE